MAQVEIRQVSKSLENNMGEKLVKEAVAHMEYVAATSNIYANIPTIEIKPSKPWGYGKK